MATKVLTDGHCRFAACCSGFALPVLTLNLLKNNSSRAERSGLSRQRVP